MAGSDIFSVQSRSRDYSRTFIFQLGSWTLFSFAKQLQKAESYQNNVIRWPDCGLRSNFAFPSELECDAKSNYVENIPISSRS